MNTIHLPHLPCMPIGRPYTTHTCIHTAQTSYNTSTTLAMFTYTYTDTTYIRHTYKYHMVTVRLQPTTVFR